MLFRPRLLRHRSRKYQRPVLWTLLTLFALDAWRILRSRAPTIRSSLTADTSQSIASGTETTKKPSVFIVSVHRNTEPILRSAWIENLVRLVDHLGRDNVYVSAVESGSQDDTKDALMELKAQLVARGVAHTIELGTTVWEQLDELYAWPDPDTPAAERPGWIWDSEEKHFALRRIPYLANVRNQAMAPLLAEAAKGSGGGGGHGQGRRFDRVLWINDVAFDTQDVMTLLNTRGGHYAAACAMDFKEYPLYYDTFALRDADGDKAVSPRWPWFRSSEARADVRAGRPVRVQSCWNGMVAFDAQPFYDTTANTNAHARGHTHATAGGGDTTHTPVPLRFRGVDDSLAEFHLEGSECCLIHADNPQSRFADVPSSNARHRHKGADADADADAGKNIGVWLNPNVRVAYSLSVYKQVRTAVFPGRFAAVHGAWANRLERARSHVQFALEGQTVLNRLRRWRAETPAGAPPRNEPGAVCLINEMQIMWQNGWKHL
ncbi:polysaccharide export protein [Sporothrix brasiliensis 5110]|uniref:Polysaccharide export protein n=1 Tax=Sporothrix brasiliensis 5110 TaxID=1398154 RepID=A0A0C2J2F0_9PEZI|nr:polysaccharide export protein [Sporothrix brasiliensis 5110]KIH91257.1 polysaccharide export protein [Sporothrix brasiliensis 5110]